MNTAGPESAELNEICNTHLNRLQGLLNFQKAGNLRALVSKLSIEYICEEVAEGLPEGLGMQMTIDYKARRDAKGSHQMCVRAREGLGISGHCQVRHSERIATGEKGHPKDPGVMREVTQLLAQLEDMVRDHATLKAMFPELSTTYRCSENRNGHELERLKMLLVVRYKAKEGAELPHDMCVLARAALGLDGECGGS